jgi:hypothetical protein
VLLQQLKVARNGAHDVDSLNGGGGQSNDLQNLFLMYRKTGETHLEIRKTRYGKGRGKVLNMGFDTTKSSYSVLGEVE